jgi:hypothetical protein
MPSHKVHAIVGKLVLGFSAKEIDDIVDRYKHDLSRISCREFFNQVSIIYKKYGEKGISYFVLHHYLDKLTSVMRGRMTKLSFRGSNLDEIKKRFIYEVRKGLLNEVSVLSLFTNILHEQFLYTPKNQEYFHAYLYHKMLVERGEYSKSTARRKANLLLEIASECREAMEEIKRTYSSDYEFFAFMKIIKNNILEAEGGVFGKLDKIICIILTEDAQIWRRYFGQDLYNKILNAINCNKI